MAERSDGSSFVMSALPNRQRAIASGSIGYIMQDLQQLDLEYYRSALLLVARAELERLRQERSAGTDVERRSKSPFGAASPTAERAASLQVACAGPAYGGPGAVRRE
jgi:hypothetical protein